MSNKQNDIYNEQLQEAEQEFKDEQESYARARRESMEALEWEELRKQKFRDAERKLKILKERE